jgi:predicted peroxiredoxin
MAAQISGVAATIYLTMNGAVWSRERSWDGVQVDGFAPLTTYVGQFIESGGRVLVCSPCDAAQCAVGDNAAAPRPAPLMAGAELCGVGHVVDLALEASVITL